MKQRKIYVVGGSHGYINWMEGIPAKNIKEADLVCFTGGEDVHPGIYGKDMHPTTSSNIHRDLIEKEMFQLAVELKKPIIGICRGSQFSCAMSGGILVQHQENPEFIHPMETNDGNFLVSSTHHQAMYPFEMKKDAYKILGWTKNLSNYHYGQSFKEELNPPVECEIVYFPKTRALGIQSHPELIYADVPIIETINYCRDLLNKHIAAKL